MLVLGFALLNTALAFFFAALFAETQFSQPVKYAFGFMLTGLIYLLVGAFVFVKGKNRLQKQNLEPERSVKELEKDKQWLKENFKGNVIIAPPSADGTPWMKKFSPYSVGVCSGWMQVRGNVRRRNADL